MASSKNFVLKNVRLAYVDLTPADGGKKRVTALIPKSDKEGIKLMKEALKNTAISEWGASAVKGIKNPILDGDTRESRDEYKDMFYINAKSGFDVTIVNQVKENLDPRQIYAGCIVNLAINAYTYTYQGQKGLSFGLSAIQFVKDGDPLGPEVGASAFDILNVSQNDVLAPANPETPVTVAETKALDTPVEISGSADAEGDDPFAVTEEDGFLTL